jgi:hypothetical protein
VQAREPHTKSRSLLKRCNRALIDLLEEIKSTALLGMVFKWVLNDFSNFLDFDSFLTQFHSILHIIQFFKLHLIKWKSVWNLMAPPNSFTLNLGGEIKFIFSSIRNIKNFVVKLVRCNNNGACSKRAVKVVYWLGKWQ